MEACSEPLLNLHDTFIYASVHVQQAQSSFYVATCSLLIPISTGLYPSDNQLGYEIMGSLFSRLSLRILP